MKHYVGDRFFGLATETKPLNVPDGATFLEQDTGQEFYKQNGIWVLIKSGSIRIYQPNHGFVVLDAIRNDRVNNQYIKALADSADNADALGLVSNVIDVDNFVLMFVGDITSNLVPSLTAGTVLFLSDATPGLLSDVEPSSELHVSKPMAIITETSVKLVVLQLRGVEINFLDNPASGSGYSGYSGYSGQSVSGSGESGYSGFSGYSGQSVSGSGESGYSGYSGISLIDIDGGTASSIYGGIENIDGGNI